MSGKPLKQVRETTLKQAPQPCYILNLPSDILEEIIRSHLALTPGNFYLHAIKTLALVHRSWLPTTRYLAYVKVAFIPKSIDHATRMLEHLKTRLPPPPAAHSDEFVSTEQTQRASCRTLFIKIVKVETINIDTAGLELFQLVGHSLQTLELRGLAGAIWGPNEVLMATLKHVPFLPRLRQLKGLDVGTGAVMAYLCAIWKGDGKTGPSGLIVHHDFELSRERDLLSLPVDMLEKKAYSIDMDQSLWSFTLDERAWIVQQLLGAANSPPASKEVPILDEDNRRPPLELYISRRNHFGEFILKLPQAKLLVNVLKRSSINKVDVWLKGDEEIGSELALAVENLGWEYLIERNAADGETTRSLLHEF
ncbi:hypothetical protein FRC01_009923 [Tulasnella sp. 417]|nr:hypothetical protein FRC01_009923 [Tulasnella sp. 417]